MDISNEILALKAWDLLNSSENYVLIDVRTPSEWAELGSPKLEDHVFRISSHTAPLMTPNPDFIKELEEAIPDKSKNLIFMCRTNGRSKIAKSYAQEAGYKNCYLMVDGYAGSESGIGWLNSKLPYEIIIA